MSKERFRLVQDDDCHWYVIPANRLEEWNEFLMDAGDVPDFADPVGGAPFLVSFFDPVWE